MEKNMCMGFNPSVFKPMIVCTFSKHSLLKELMVLVGL